MPHRSASTAAYAAVCIVVAVAACTDARVVGSPAAGGAGTVPSATGGSGMTLPVAGAATSSAAGGAGGTGGASSASAGDAGGSGGQLVGGASSSTGGTGGGAVASGGAVAGGGAAGGSSPSSGGGGSGDGGSVAALTRDLPPCETVRSVCVGELLASDLGPVRSLYLRDGLLYFHDAVNVWRVPSAGGTPEAVRSELPGLTHFDFGDQGDLVYTKRSEVDSDTEGLFRGPLEDSGADVALAVSPRMFGFFLRGSSVFAGGGSLGTYRVPLAGGEAVLVVDASCLDFTQSSTRTFCRTTNGFGEEVLYELDLVNETTTPLSIVAGTSVATAADDLAANDNYLYVSGVSPDGLWRVAMADLQDEVVTDAFNPSGLAVDSGGAYVSVDEHGTNPAIYYALDGASEALPIATVEHPLLSGSSVTLNEQYVYWLEADYVDGELGALYRAPRCGCE